MTRSHVENAPAKVRDGLAASTLRRRLWSFSWYSLVTPEGHERPYACDVLDAIVRNEKRVVVLSMGDPDLPGLGVITTRVRIAASFDDFLSREDCVPADVVHIGTDLVRDVDGARRAGFAAVWIKPCEVRPPRGVVRVADLGDLRRLVVEGSLTSRTGTTYHEM